MRYEGKEFDCMEVWIGGNCHIDNCQFKYQVGNEDPHIGCTAIGITEMGIMVTLHNGSIRMYEGLPYQAWFAPRKEESDNE